MNEISIVKTGTKNDCLLCKSVGNVLYSDIKDQLFSAPGKWNLSTCPSCNLIWLNPFPLPEELGKIYGSYYTHEDTNYYANQDAQKSFTQKLGDYFRFQVYRSFGYKEALAKAGIRYTINIGGNIPFLKSYIRQDMLSVKPSWGKKLLDVGAGNGEFLKVMNMLGWEVEGTETDPKAAEFARVKYKLKMHTGFLSEIALPDNSFDVITLSHVIEHVYDPDELMLECKRILKPGGRLVLLTPNSQSLAHKIYKQSWRGLEIPRHMFVFSLDNFRILAERAGFACENLTSSARIARYLYSTSAHIKQGKFAIGQGGKRGYFLALKSYCFQAVEELCLIFNKKVGEEIYFVGKKI